MGRRMRFVGRLYNASYISLWWRWLVEEQLCDMMEPRGDLHCLQPQHVVGSVIRMQNPVEVMCTTVIGLIVLMRGSQEGMVKASKTPDFAPAGECPRRRRVELRG